MDGQSETALARDVLSTWLQIPLPADPSKSGWVSIQTKYSAVSGDIMSLPEIVPRIGPCWRHFAIAASIRWLPSPAALSFPRS